MIATTCALLAAAMGVFPQATSSPDTILETQLEVALGTAGLTTQSARFDPNLLRFFRHGAFTTSLYDAGFENPWRLPFFMRTQRRELATFAGRPSEAVGVMARWLGTASRRTLLGNPNAADEQAAAREGALGALLSEWREKRYVTASIPDLAEVPLEAQRAAALILRVVERADLSRRLAFASFGDPSAVYKTLAEATPDADIASAEARRKLYALVDTRHLWVGGHDLLLAAQTAATYLRAVPASATYSVEIPTVYGLIRLTGGSNTRHPNRPTLLVLDTGGDDVYSDLPYTGSASHGISVVLDSAGKDRYLSDLGLESAPVAEWEGRKRADQTPGPGGALMGFSILVDLAGDDLYRTHAPGLGSARLGLAALLDAEGDDTYEAYQDSQGFGMFGIGILEDTRGNDRYLGFRQVQGVGQSGGAGYLVDWTGDDVYEANATVIDFPSPQTAQHNVSMAQGAANGRRADYLDGHSLAAGVGLLFDGAGNDRYTCGVFGQGVGYWMGLGMLWDSAGNDVYTGQWYVQGASAHYALGVLEDEGGDDQYFGRMNMAQGAGHDFGVGMLLDHAGADRYEAPNLSLGAGNANGLGVFVDVLGNDRYTSNGITLGRAAEAPKASLRERALALGLFLDLGGDDVYPAGVNYAVNGRREANWVDRGLSPSESQVGVFWDR